MHFFLPLKAKMYSTCPRTRNYSTPHVLPLRTGFVVSALQNLTSFEVENSLPAFVRGQQIGAACLHANQKNNKNANVSTKAVCKHKRFDWKTAEHKQNTWKMRLSPFV